MAACAQQERAFGGPRQPRPPTFRGPGFGRAKLLLSRDGPCRLSRSFALAWWKVGVAPLVHSFRIRCAYSASPPSFSPPCEGGVRGGGPVSFECTKEPCWARPIDAADGACVASPCFKACRFRTSLRATGEHTDDSQVLRPTPGEAEAVWPTPPGPPFTRGGKEGGLAEFAQRIRKECASGATPTFHHASFALPRMPVATPRPHANREGAPRHPRNA